MNSLDNHDICVTVVLSKCCLLVSNAAYVMLDISKPCFLLKHKSKSSCSRLGSWISSWPLLPLRTGEIGANGKPAVACEVCGKKLADPSSLYRHRKIHSGDKPHKCPHCCRSDSSSKFYPFFYHSWTSVCLTRIPKLEIQCVTDCGKAFLLLSADKPWNAFLGKCPFPSF